MTPAQATESPAAQAIPAGLRVISIAGLDKAGVLATLYNNARMQGKGVRNPAGSAVLTREQAADLLSRWTDFDYLQGRVLKVDLSGDEFTFGLYDRDNGEEKPPGLWRSCERPDLSKRSSERARPRACLPWWCDSCGTVAGQKLDHA
jgi:hypothetical protein